MSTKKGDIMCDHHQVDLRFDYKVTGIYLRHVEKSFLHLRSLLLSLVIMESTI